VGKAKRRPAAARRLL